MKEFSKIIGAIIVIIASFIFFDFIFGEFVTRTLIAKKSKQEYLLNEKNYANIVFFGSSRANHHYDTPYITDSLGIKAFNGGEDGRGLTYQLPLIKTYLELNKPELIVLEVSPFLDGSWNDRLSLLYPYVDGNSYILEAASMLDPNNRIYLKSKLFQHNSNLIPELKNQANPFNPRKSYGFVPLPPISTSNLVMIPSDSSTKQIDLIELNALKEILETARNHNVDIIGVISPLYIAQRPIVQSDTLFKEFGYHFIDNSMVRFKDLPKTYFQDNSHLNAIGAREYTKYFMKQILDSLNLIHMPK